MTTPSGGFLFTEETKEIKMVQNDVVLEIFYGYYSYTGDYVLCTYQNYEVWIRVFYQCPREVDSPETDDYHFDQNCVLKSLISSTFPQSVV